MVKNKFLLIIRALICNKKSTAISKWFKKPHMNAVP